MENNFDILGIPDGSSQHDVREAFRRLALQHHSDRGGEDEYFKKIKQAYEDLKAGKKYPDTDAERLRGSRVYTDDSDAEIRRQNVTLAGQLAADMETAQEWIGALTRTNSTGIRLFGSKTLGEMEIERKATGTISIKGNYKAGRLVCDAPITLQGNITSPSWSPDHLTVIHVKRGDFKMINPMENKYKIENGAKIISDNGDIMVGNVFGRKERVPDAAGRVGLDTVRELWTELNAPRGKVIVENAVNTVSIAGRTIIILNMEDDVRLEGRDILVYGSKITYDVRIRILRGGTIRFFEDFSIRGLSDDATIELEDGTEIPLYDLKTKKVRDLSESVIPGSYDTDATLVGHGFTITYEMLRQMREKPARKGWFGFKR